MKVGSAPDLGKDRARALDLVPVSRETAERLDTFTALLTRWQQTTNLIAPSTIPELWTRHIADSLQLVSLAPDARIWIDLGAGGGFPGIPIACALVGQAGASVHLVESNQKKAAFLREAIRVTGAPGIVHAERIETFSRRFSGDADIITARALAPIEELMALIHPLMKTGAKALFLKGQDVEAELTQAAKCWNIDAALVPSKTSPQGRIVMVRRAEPRP